MRFFKALPLVLSVAAAAPQPAAAQSARPLTFTNDISPILTKAGCNAGACHAKAGNGQNGFRLSLFGYEPEEDYEHIVKEGHGRRIFPNAPEQSLLLLKACNATPHGGGNKLPKDSAGYRMITEWIAQGMAYGKESDPKLARLEVLPAVSTSRMRSAQQLKVTAHFSDGQTRDVTSLAIYEPNDKSMATSNESGLVQFSDLPGNVSIMIRYQNLVAVHAASIPMGLPVDNVPTPRNFVDELVFANLKRLGIPPSSIADDSTFIRRASLDITGRLPSPEETRAFLDNQSENKQDELIQSLLETSEYADFFANKWAAILRNKRIDKGTKASFAFHSWVRDGLLANKPYDQMVRELLAATGDPVSNPPVAWYNQVKTPEQQLEDVSQLFLGVRMTCAQCHHHPFERWSQRDYYGLSAFFSQIGRRPTATAGQSLIFHKRGVAQAEHKKTKEQIKPAGLGAAPKEIAPDEDPRIQLAEWMSGKDNPFFAKALANRYWKHFFNRGLVEPEDDMRESNPPSNPELLNALARHFTESGYDLKALIFAITRSNAYRLSSASNGHNAADRQNFSHYYPRRLNAEVLLDSIDRVADAATDFADLPSGTRAIALPDNSYNKASYFLTVFGRPEGDSVCECERVQAPNLSQSLHLMNAADVKTKLSKANGRADQLAKSKKQDDENLKDLYMLTFCREPRANELSAALAHINVPRTNAEGAPLDLLANKKIGYEDIIWALCNTKEFLYNH
jgi:hypothetical protein